MSKRTAITWGVFAACVACGAALLAWLTVTMLDLERSEARARAHAGHEIAIGAALWQMDAWLLPLLTTEAQRPTTDYQAFNPVQDAYTNLYSKLTPGDVVAPSPLLTFRSPYFPLHFQIDGEGHLTSPQVPEGNALDVAQSQEQELHFDAQRQLLDKLRRVLSPKTLVMQCSVGAAALPEAQIANRIEAEGSPQMAWNSNYGQRAQITKPARQMVAHGEVSPPTLDPTPHGPAVPSPTTTTAGAPRTDGCQLVPMWLDDQNGKDWLAFVRRTTQGGSGTFQGVIADWDGLAAGMIAQIREPTIAAGARLVRSDRPDVGEQPHLLTVLPARLETTPPEVRVTAWTPVRSLLVVAWLALLATAAVVAFTLRAALTFGDKRARFASAVTHELRTPLTTFKMYSEMLATGMVTDPVRRQQYLQTLQSESDRLGRLVENVLGYARIEDGRFTARIETVALDAMLARLHPILERRARDAGYDLEIDVPRPGVRVEVDIDAVGQILFNLVDNACKYGRPPLHLTAHDGDAGVRLAVRDHGPGIPKVYRARVFAAFDRGGRQPGDNEVPGIGLGLALARGLAKDMGGDLVLRDDGPGACFELTLPVGQRPQA